ncbi:MAG: hypothetical protein IPP48_17195 [Chitinophagaceae bacterium]|nr:hypothetical protein [Chitinophagaceae bacterium]
MRYIKFFLLNLIVFGSLFFVISLLLPSTVGVSKSISVNADKTIVAKQISDITNWQKWNSYSSVSNNIKISTDSLVKVHHPSDRFGNLTSLFVIQGNGAVNVSWALQQKLRWYYPWGKFAAMVTEKSWIEGMDSSLTKLKQLCEANQGN